MNGNIVTFNLDLHWNYSTEAPKQSANGTGENNYNSGQQLPMAGVFILGNGNMGSLPDNTIEFWKSLAMIFGVDSNGNELTSNNVEPSIKPNIFFELYNEPFIDNLVTTAYAGYSIDLAYNSGYNIYINGGTAYLANTDNLYSFTGMGRIYNEIRNLNCANILIIGGAESYSYMLFNNNAQWSYPYDGNPAPNTILNTYNCFTKLQTSIEEGLITQIKYSKINKICKCSKQKLNYISSLFYNVIANLHPYCGLYSGASKAPGYYNNIYPNNNQPGFGQIVSALHNQTLNYFYINFSIICTEFRQYDLSWSNYDSSNIIQDGSAYSYNLSNLNYPANPPYIIPSGVSLGSPNYIGFWIDSVGSINYGPPIIGYLNDFIELNISFTIWDMRPNSGGSGNGIGCNSRVTGYGWEAI